jgi:hypothetical protein
MCTDWQGRKELVDFERVRGVVAWAGWSCWSRIDFPVRVRRQSQKIARANFAFQIASKFYILNFTFLNIVDIPSFINVISEFGLKLVLKWVVRA